MILNAVVGGAERVRRARVGACTRGSGLRDVDARLRLGRARDRRVRLGRRRADSHWQAREVALGLPVAGVPAGERFRSEYFDEHPMGRAGVAVGRDLRPEGHENVLVAGATLAGAQPWREKSGDGISLSTGHRAAELILGATVPRPSARGRPR